jgi:hypothetical protein
MLHSTVSKAPPLPQTAAKKKFAIGKKEASDDEKRKELMQKMFATAKDVEDKAEQSKSASVKDEEKEVADDEWVSIFAKLIPSFYYFKLIELLFSGRLDLETVLYYFGRSTTKHESIVFMLTV